MRREEAATLAGITVDGYMRLERGNASGVSERCAKGSPRALQLDEAERTHISGPARTANTTSPARRRPTEERARPSVPRVLDSMTEVPAYVRNGRLDILAASHLGHALSYSAIFADPVRPANVARLHGRCRA